MPNDKPNVMTELAPKGPRFVEIIEIMVDRTSPFLKNCSGYYTTGKMRCEHFGLGCELFAIAVNILVCAVSYLLLL